MVCIVVYGAIFGLLFYSIAGMGTDPLCVSRGAANSGDLLTVSILSVIPKTAF